MSIDTDLDRLYQLPPGEFITERNALAKRAGARAAEVRARPKPTLAVWAVNQVHWRKPDVFRSLLENAGNLRATHKAVLAGRAGDLRAAGKAHEAALEAALKAALAVVADAGHPASDATRQAIATTLRALPAEDPPGRLRQALSPSGFEALAGIPSGARVLRPPARSAPGRAASSTPSASGSASRGADKPKPDKAALAAARKVAASAARILASAEQASRREEFEAARSAREADKAERRVARAKEAVADARAELEAAEREATTAARKRDAARARAAAADRALADARARARGRGQILN